MANKMRSRVLLFLAGVGFASAHADETVHAWKFDTSARAAAIVAPTAASGVKTTVWSAPSFVARGAKGAPRLGLAVIFR